MSIDGIIISAMEMKAAVALILEQLFLEVMNGILFVFKIIEMVILLDANTKFDNNKLRYRSKFVI